MYNSLFAESFILEKKYLKFFHWLQIALSQGVTEWVPDEFHERLSVHMCDNIEEVERFYAENYHVLTGNYGVLKFMYTVLLTKV